MAKDERSLAHAQHNDKAIKYLDKSPDHLDWVITMCFYSSLHYVRYFIFPVTMKTGDGKSYKIDTFNKFCAHMRYVDVLSKHERLLNLVSEKCPNIASEYNQLMDMSSLARYNDYKADREMSNIAKVLHKTIKEFCEPNEETEAVSKEKLKT